MRPRHKRRIKVIFPSKATSSSLSSSSSTTARHQRETRPKPCDPREAYWKPTGGRVMNQAMTGPANPPGHVAVPSLFKTGPPIKDDLVTETSTKQDETVRTCLPLLAGPMPGRTEFDFTPYGVPRLERDQHVDFLKEHLEAARFVAYDASRPWVVYWCLTALCLLGEDVTEYRQRSKALVYCIYKERAKTTLGLSKLSCLPRMLVVGLGVVMGI